MRPHRLVLGPPPLYQYRQRVPVLSFRGQQIVKPLYSICSFSTPSFINAQNVHHMVLAAVERCGTHTLSLSLGRVCVLSFSLSHTHTLGIAHPGPESGPVFFVFRVKVVITL